MTEKGYRGLDIDFEYVRAEDGLAFAEFTGRVRRVLQVFGYPVLVALAPKTSPDQKGLLYEGIDYRLLGETADRVTLMTYEWGYTYGPPMAVAPLNMVRRVVEYAVSAIPVEKISLGIPNYGYEWPLPYVRGTTKAQSISNRGGGWPGPSIMESRSGLTRRPGPHTFVTGSTGSSMRSGLRMCGAFMGSLT